MRCSNSGNALSADEYDDCCRFFEGVTAIHQAGLTQRIFTHFVGPERLRYPVNR